MTIVDLMHRAILSPYVNPNNANLEEYMLPSAEEVLLCGPTTTVEEVEIFLRRASSMPKEKIFTLANVDILTFEQQKEVEEALDEQIRDVPGECAVVYWPQ